MKIKKYRPNFFSGFEDVYYEVNSKEELLESERFAAVKANEYIWLRLTRPYEMDRYGKRKYESFNVKTNEFTKD